MNFALTPENEMLRETFARFFASEVGMAAVRSSEQSGLDRTLWSQYADMGLFAVRVPAPTGGDASLLAAALIAEEVGRALVPGPLIETIVAARLLTQMGSDDAQNFVSGVIEGRVVLALGVHDSPSQLVYGGSAANAVLLRHDQNIYLIERQSPPQKTEDMGSSLVARWSVDDPDQRATILASGAQAVALFESAIEEWKLLKAAALIGLSAQAVQMAADYAKERVQFGRPIGSFQAIAHPLADSLVEIEAGRLLCWSSIWAIARGRRDAGARLSGAFWRSSQIASRAVARSLHVFGGYGLSLEYDIQLYHLRAKSWALIAGDPRNELDRMGRRLWEGETVSLPEAGDIELEFDFDDDALAFAERAKRFFDAEITPELRPHAHHSWEGHHPLIQKRLAEEGLLFPDWPREHGGEQRDAFQMAALAAAFHEARWTRHAIQVTNMVAHCVMMFGNDQLKAEVLPRFAKGEAIASFGFSEPSAGSDVFATKTAAARENDGSWLINGQKMFTSGADIAQYVLLLTRSDPNEAKHRGLTIFLVPLDARGVEVQAIHTLSDERTNITFYSDVRVPDHYRLGEIGSGAAVIGAALSMEHADTGYPLDHARLLKNAVSWAKATSRNGQSAIQDPAVRARLSVVAVNSYAADLLARRALWAGSTGLANRSFGPMGKLFATEAYISDASELLDLTAPDSLLHGDEKFELAYRHSTATSIYGGSSEIMRSIIAESALELPKTRS